MTMKKPKTNFYGVRQNDFSLAVLAAKAVKKIYHRSLLLL